MLAKHVPECLATLHQRKLNIEGNATSGIYGEATDAVVVFSQLNTPTRGSQSLVAVGVAMARLALSAAVLGLIRVAAVHAGTAEERPDLASQEIKVETQYGDNATDASAPARKGWQKTKTCVDEFCLFFNQDAAGGRGISVVSTDEEMENIREIIDRAQLGKAGKQPYSVKDGRYVAGEGLRRGRQLESLAPVLLVNKVFLDEIPQEEHNKMLEAAVQRLPRETRRIFDAQDPLPKGERNITNIVTRMPITVTPDPVNSMSSEAHYANFPEAAAYTHDCRPNVAFHLSSDFVFRAAVARRVGPGEGLTVSHLRPLHTRAERTAMAEHIWGHPCGCATCSAGGGDLAAIARSDGRVEEIQAIVRELEEIASRQVTKDLIDRYLVLLQEENLQAYLADAYWRAAINYSYLGFKDEAVKYASRAVQAAIVEGGKDASLPIEIRIFLQDPLGHYSWRRRLTVRGEA